MGLIILAFFLNGKKTSCSYGPDARVLKNIKTKKINYSQAISTLITNKTIDTVTIDYILKEGDVNFSESSPRQNPCGIFVVECNYNNDDVQLTIENCDSIATVLDVVFSFIGLIILFPFLLIIAFLIKLDSKGPILFIQGRVGKNNKDFNIYKFRTMRVQSDKKGLLTLGNNDSRITRIGYFLRRYKIDEFPQLLNILKGDMSFVGPRPELRYYVNFYSEDDMDIFKVRPGITGLASLKYRNEVELLKAADNPEEFFVKTIIPDKLKYNKEYIKKQNFFFDLKLIALTIIQVITK